MISDSAFNNLTGKLKAFGNQLPDVHEHLQLAVTIPAKNEADTIWKTLQALSKQFLNDQLLPSEVYEVFVLCNHCNDHTRDICELFQNTHPGFPLYIFETNSAAINSVGAARRILMDLASKRIPNNGFIIMTDADTIADQSWLNAFLELQSHPADLVCGIINPDLKGLNDKARKSLFQNRQYLDLVTRLEGRLFPQPSDPWPRHSHNSGPNMGIRNSVYKKLGGIPPLACFEDIALYQKVISMGFKVKHDNKPVVTTSCRSFSRVSGGFGTQIKNWNDSKIENVEGFRKLCERFKAYAEIRKYYQNWDHDLLVSFSKRLFFQPDHMKSILQNHPRSTSVIINLEHLLKFHTPWNSAFPNIPIDRAMEELNDYFATFSQTSSSYSSSR